MAKKDFCWFREKLQKTQKEMAQLLGISLKAIESYEQGWRNIPAPVERQVLFFLAMKTESYRDTAPCWEIRGCDPEMRRRCPVWEFKAGHFCWFMNGIICQGKPQAGWRQKIDLCRKCTVFKSMLNHWGLPE